jgi:isopentenyl-diphosphate delta-isomerase
MANLGAPQLGAGWGVREASEAVDMIEADGLAIHLNPLQEAAQPGGEPRYRGVLDKVREIKEALSVPIVVKETGAGISSEDARRLEDVGVSVLDVSGAGGTSWAAVEYYRAMDLGDDLGLRLGKTFWDWGIPTAACIVECARSTSLPLIASGGIRSGLDAAKAIALGADLVGIALPFLKAAAKGRRALQWEIEMILGELSCAMFLTGARDLEELGRVPIVATGFLADWLQSRGYSTADFARRSLDV